MLKDGCDFTEVSVDDGDEEFPRSLMLTAYSADDLIHIDYDSVDECDETQSFSVKLNKDSIAPYTFSLSDLALISQAFHGATEYCLSCLDVPELSADDRSMVTSDMKMFEKKCSDLDNFLSGFLRS